jgi:glycosyltransferase involved in cell wall biosynthesis
MKDGISIIIPTYKTPEYLYECIESIKSQITNFDYEILIGVDNCEETLTHIKKNKDFYNGINIFYFDKNVGPYIVRNNLVDEVKYNYILFFDSDDLMNEGMLETIYKEVVIHNYVRIKFINFTIVKGVTKFSKTETAYGVFAISKELFDKFVGFESWICNADVEFHHRLKFHNHNFYLIKPVLFNRRLHDVNLTRKPETAMNSPLRVNIRSKLAEKIIGEHWSNPEKIKKDYKKIYEIQIT